MTRLKVSHDGDWQGYPAKVLTADGWVDFTPKITGGIKRVWRQDTPPPAGTTYEWAGEPHASESVKRVDGEEVARNPIVPPTNVTLGWVSGIYANVSIADGVAIVTSTNDTTNSVLPRLQRVSINHGATPVTPGSEFHLRAEVRHSRGMPMHINAWFLTESNGSAGQVPGGNVLADGWQVAHVSGTVPANASFMGWQVRVDSSTDVGPSFVGDVFEVRHLSPFPDYFDGDTASDRANDLWYDADGVPHVWVNGQGWTAVN